MSIGNKLKELRMERLWTQNEVAKRTGLGRGYLAQLETDVVTNPSADTFLKLARAFNIRPEELYQAAGYIIDTNALLHHKETPEDILDRLKLAQPQSVPVYTEYPIYAGEGTEPIEYVYRDRAKPTPKNIEGYLIHGDSLAPEVMPNDIVIVDRDGSIDNGNIVIALVDGRLYISRLRKVGGELWLENNFGKIKFDECQVSSPVIEVIRRLK